MACIHLSLEANTFSTELVNLNLLDLSYNKVTVLKENVFMCEHLQWLDMSSNQLVNVSEKAFHNSPSLLGLELSSCLT